MADQRKRGGQKQGTHPQPEARKQQGVRPGSTEAAKDHGNEAAREKLVPKPKDRTQERQSD